MITLRELNPIAASQWDYHKNGKMTPDNIAGKSGKKAWFICSNNPKHKWETKIYQRTNGTTGENIGCPYCNGRLAFHGETDFLTICPEAKDFWDYDKNGDLNPSRLLPSSRKSVYFKCSRGHEFDKLVYNFTKSPKCRECYLEDNNITVTHPNIVTMWDYEINEPDIPEMFLKTSDVKVWWKCDRCGYRWKSEIASRTASKGLCPNCDVNIVFKSGYNDIKTQHPELLKFWNYDKNTEDPSNINRYDKRKFLWKCNDCGYEWKMQIANRIVNKKGKVRYTGCMVCDGNTAITGKSDLATTHPILAREYVSKLNTKPVTKIKAGSNTIRYWKCSRCDQIFPAQPNSRTRYKDQKLHGCPYCDGRLPIKGKNDFKTVYPELAEEWDYDLNVLNPDDYTTHSDKHVYWKCKSNPSHKWVASINTRSQGFARCPKCTQIKEGETLSDLHSELLKYWDYDLNLKGPEYYTEFSNESVYWRCDEGHSYKMEIYRYTKDKYYCPICKGSRLIVGVNDLATIYPEFLEIWDYEANEKTPYDITFSPRMSYYYKCDKGHTWHNRIGRVIETNFTCDYCSNRRVLANYNSLQALCSNIASELVDEHNQSSSDSIFPSNWSYRRWKCNECGQIFSATIKGRTNGTETCPYCDGIKATPGVNSFAALYPQLMDIFSLDNQFNPDFVLPNYSKRTIWECHEYEMQWIAPLRDVVEGRRECPYCSGEKVVPGKTSLKALYPQVAEKYYEGNTIPSDYVIPTSSEYVFWVCQEYGELFRARVREMVDGSATCPYCTGRKAVPGVTSFKALYPEVAEEFDDPTYNSDEIMPIFAVRVKWKCKEYGLPFYATVRGMVEGTESCPYCTGRKAVHGINSFKAMYPSLIEVEWKFLSNILLANPDEILPTNSKSFFWECSKCGTTYKASPKARVQNLQRNIESCPACKGLRQKFINY